MKYLKVNKSMGIVTLKKFTLSPLNAPLRYEIFDMEVSIKRKM